ncbi:hypothetical protein [Streptomyces phaeochromogenes]
MASLSPEHRSLRATIAAKKRHHPDRPDLVEDDVRALKVLALAEHIRKVVNNAPRPSREQCARLAELLMPEPAAACQGGGGADVA